MRNFLFLILFLGFGNQMIAQDAIREAYVQYEVTEVNSSDPQTDAMLQMMKGSTIDIHFNESKQRMDMDMMGGMMKMSTFMNTGEDVANAMYMDMMGKKIKVSMTDEELEKYQSKSEMADQKPTVTPDYGTVKEINGFKCHKVTITYEGTDELSLVAFVTRDVTSPESVIQNTGDLDLGGFPLEYMIENPQFNMTYTTKVFEQDVAGDAFVQPKGYESMTFDEFIQTMGAMGGMGQ